MGENLLLKSACLESLTQWAQINAVFIKCFIYKYRLHTKHALENYILDFSVCPNKRVMHNNTYILNSQYDFFLLLTVGSTPVKFRFSWEMSLIHFIIRCWTLDFISMLPLMVFIRHSAGVSQTEGLCRPAWSCRISTGLRPHWTHSWSHRGGRW